MDDEGRRGHIAALEHLRLQGSIVDFEVFEGGEHEPLRYAVRLVPVQRRFLDASLRPLGVAATEIPAARAETASSDRR